MKALLQFKYELSDLGDLQEYLGISIIRFRTDRSLILSQSAYAKKILVEFHLADCLPSSSPSANSVPLPANPLSTSAEDWFLYQAQLGSLMYLSVWTHPDLSERCSRLGQYATNPSLEHSSSLRHVFSYLAGTTSLSLKFQPPASPDIEIHNLGFVGYTDGAYADNAGDLKSTSDYLFKFSDGIVSWKSRKQTVTATSSTEAEYIGYTLASKEAIWLRTLLHQLGYESSNVQKVTLYGDNMPAISLTINPEHHNRTKHIAISWHFVHEQVKLGLIHLDYLRTTDMPADGLTKPL